VRDLYFQHKALKCIHGQHHIGSLWTLSNELKPNASAVPVVLGSGAFGHLATLAYSSLILSIQPCPRYWQNLENNKNSAPCSPARPPVSTHRWKHVQHHAN